MGMTELIFESPSPTTIDLSNYVSRKYVSGPTPSINIFLKLKIM